MSEYDEAVRDQMEAYRRLGAAIDMEAAAAAAFEAIQ